MNSLFCFDCVVSFVSLIKLPSSQPSFLAFALLVLSPIRLREIEQVIGWELISQVGSAHHMESNHWALKQASCKSHGANDSPAFVTELDGFLQEFNNRTPVIQVGPSKPAVLDARKQS